MRKKYLVLYEEPWMLSELRRSLPLQTRLSQVCDFVYMKKNFKQAAISKTAQGTRISDAWLQENLYKNTDILGVCDGLVIILDGERLGGRNGVHVKKVYGGRQFSLIQMEAKKGWYRKWKQRNGIWELMLTRSRKAGNYKQILYTFEHEIGHSLCYLFGVSDTLHLYVQNSLYENWWQLLLTTLEKKIKL